MAKARKLALLGALIVGAVFLASWMFASTPVANAPPGPGPIVAFGDSLTEGLGASQGQTYPEQLERLLGRHVIGRGVAGETAAVARRRLESDVLAEKPAIVIVFLGGNDLLQRLPGDATFAALEDIVVHCQSAGAMVVLVGVEGPILVSERFGPRFKKLARQRGCVYVPDIMDGIIGHGDLLSDGLHPNDRGYAIIAERLAAAIRPRLD